jgi:hypothetical protein
MTSDTILQQACQMAPVGSQIQITSEPATVVGHYRLPQDHRFSRAGVVLGIRLDQPDTRDGETTVHSIDIYVTLEELTRLLARAA